MTDNELKSACVAAYMDVAYWDSEDCVYYGEGFSFLMMKHDPALPAYVASLLLARLVVGPARNFKQYRSTMKKRYGELALGAYTKEVIRAAMEVLKDD